MTTTGILTMTIESDGTLLCACGNTPDDNGFDACHADGTLDDTLLEATSMLEATSSRPIHFACAACGQISQAMDW